MRLWTGNIYDFRDDQTHPSLACGFLGLFWCMLISSWHNNRLKNVWYFQGVGITQWKWTANYITTCYLMRTSMTFFLIRLFQFKFEQIWITFTVLGFRIIYWNTKIWRTIPRMLQIIHYNYRSPLTTSSNQRLGVRSAASVYDVCYK